MSKIIATDTLLWLNGTWAGQLVQNGGNVFEYASSLMFGPFDWLLHRSTLRNWWGITKRNGLLEKISLLTQNEPYRLRAGYEKAAALREVWELSDVAFYEKLKEMNLTQDDRNDLIAVHAIGQQAHVGTIIGYDYARAIMLCSYGYNSGYLKRDESIDMAIECGKKLQPHFSSWDEMTESYLTGYLFWLIVARQSLDENWAPRVTAVEKVQNMPNGPYSLNWNMPLCR